MTLPLYVTFAKALLTDQSDVMKGQESAGKLISDVVPLKSHRLPIACHSALAAAKPSGVDSNYFGRFQIAAAAPR